MKRADLKQKPRLSYCPAGHELKPVLVVGAGMKDMCACSGYAPIDVTRPYQSRQARQTHGGKARIWFERLSFAFFLTLAQDQYGQHWYELGPFSSMRDCQIQAETYPHGSACYFREGQNPDVSGQEVEPS